MEQDLDYNIPCQHTREKLGNRGGRITHTNDMCGEHTVGTHYGSKQVMITEVLGIVLSSSRPVGREDERDVSAIVQQIFTGYKELLKFCLSQKFFIIYFVRLKRFSESTEYWMSFSSLMYFKLWYKKKFRGAMNLKIQTISKKTFKLISPSKLQETVIQFQTIYLK